MSNAQTLDNLRYCAEAFSEEYKTQAESNLKAFAAELIGFGISPPAQKPVSELGGSGAGLVETPLPLALVHVWFKCPDFGINDEVCTLSNWPKNRRLLGRRVLRVQLVGSLV